jgi:UDP-N-acetyl-D-galactosamine dehydrogenase
MHFNDIVEGNKKIAVVGLGYVGLPIALEFAKKTPIIGFDINAERVALMRQHIDPSKELEKEDFAGTDIHFTADPDDLKEAHFFIVAVPTPINQHRNPDLRALLGASETVGKVLKKGDCVVYESTVYPGCTEQDCVPVLEKFSGLKAYDDFNIGYSPERINPGDKEHTLTKITKVVSADSPEALELVASVYEMVVEAGVYKASSIKVAEAAKVIENTQRDLNIALMNELSRIFNKMNINTFEVLEAAGTKWNFLKFRPGLVGGHCIGVDPYYLTHKAEELGYHPQVILSGRSINDTQGAYVVKEAVQKMAKMGINIGQARALVLGATFKEDVSDIRNSKVVDVIHELENYGIHVDTIDPYASASEFQHEYGLPLAKEARGPYQLIVGAVSHKEYLQKPASWLSSLGDHTCLLVDLKGAYKDKVPEFEYWSL